jgi:UDP-2,3-diacylglucosamine pyrophosphatase LpxH
VNDYPRQFDELYVISDLHMGGQPGFQIFNRGRRLGAFVDRITGERPEDELALVINGDVFDSLAEPGVPDYVALDSGTAVAMLDRIAGDKAFAPVFEALARFVRTERRHLVLMVGNHDIELALPVVEEWFRQRLAQGDAAAQSRLRFASHGEGFACRVGAARVFCTHGNEVDAWNLVDYNLLGQLANALNAGRAVNPAKWTPNAGTRLVKDVMNAVKAKYPFVDLLKPEKAAVAAVLMVLDKKIFQKIDLASAFPILRDKVKGGLVVRRLLGPEATSFAGVEPRELAEEVAAQLLGDNLHQAVLAAQAQQIVRSTEDDLLLAAGIRLAEGRRAVDLVASTETVETLGFGDLIDGWLGVVRPAEGLRRALSDWLADDISYDPNGADDTFRSVRDRVADTVDVVITGHTHLARALSLGGRRWYFNGGTWIRLLRLTGEALAEDVFETQVWPQVTRKLADLDASTIPGPGGAAVPLVFDRTNATHVSNQGGRVVGELLRVTGVEDGTPLQLAPEDGTKTQEIRS